MRESLRLKQHSHAPRLFGGFVMAAVKVRVYEPQYGRSDDVGPAILIGEERVQIV